MALPPYPMWPPCLDRSLTIPDVYVYCARGLEAPEGRPGPSSLLLAWTLLRVSPALLLPHSLHAKDFPSLVFPFHAP